MAAKTPDLGRFASTAVVSAKPTGTRTRTAASADPDMVKLVAHSYSNSLGYTVAVSDLVRLTGDSKKDFGAAARALRKAGLESSVGVQTRRGGGKNDPYTHIWFVGIPLKDQDSE